MIYDYIVIGGGAAGLFFGAAIEKKCKGLILEKTARIGTKLLMSGNGQCNITHGGSIKDFIARYGKNGGKVRSCLYQYHNDHLRDFLHENGVETFIREDGKVFPKSLSAKEIRDMLQRKCQENGFSFLTEREVTSISHTENHWQLTCGKESFHAYNIIIATGGCSYPTTGSNGAMLTVLQRDLGIDIIQPKPALSPLRVKDYPFTEISGIAFPDAQAVILHDGKSAASNVGGLLFTHKDFSGPAVMNISKHGINGDYLKLNYLYPLTYEEAFAQLRKAMEVSKENTANILAGTFDLPKRFARIIADRAGNSPKELAKMLTGDSFTITSIGSFNQAMATAGGISLKELNTKTMELKKHPGLFAIGEVVDIDGITGGYNLQFAYSSANAAVHAG